MEEIVVVAIIAMLVAIGLPAARSLYKSVEAEAGGKAMISAAFSAARAIAAKEQRYAGVRFQYAYYKDDPNKSPLKSSQYMIFIVNEEYKKMGNINTGFRAVKGIKPIKLPDSVGVMDLKLSPDQIVNNNNKINDDWELTDTTSFSIIFSPSGKMVLHKVRVRNRDAKTEGESPQSKDDIFNTLKQITNLTEPHGMFAQDDYPTPGYLGYDEEPSRRSFIIYDRNILEKLDPAKRYTDYLEDFVKNKKEIFINPYTGTMIDK